MRVAEVRARVTGIVQKQLFKEGADVKEGDVLFEIDPALLEANLDSVKASLARSEANVAQADQRIARNKPLLATKAVSQQDNDDAITEQSLAKADVLAAKALLEKATINLGYTKVISPINGRIGQARVTEGALVSSAEATPMGLVQQMDPIYFDFTQSSTEMLKLRGAMESGQLKSSPDGGTRVTLLLEDGSTYKHEGKLLFSDITVDPTTGMVTRRAEFPNPV
ncbi:MAG: efflux transporter periplasmic adaptor subunit, partial [Verrucomicrobiaceae bacterium]|nr:efflux transporter periplasmic adaptor subunit [Verrucomicrobiaceae bacterium]